MRLCSLSGPLATCEKLQYSLANAVRDVCRFSDDELSHDIERQFLWGAALLITPILEEVSDHWLFSFVCLNTFTCAVHVDVHVHTCTCRCT